MASLERVLRRFVDMYRNGEPALLASDERDVVARSRDVSHSLRGACAAAGATRLAEQLQAFERELSASTEVPVPLSRARRLHEDLVVLVSRLAAELGA
jgi:HPt (histidine-containing phosphotransfer) domain-containing protein